MNQAKSGEDEQGCHHQKYRDDHLQNPLIWIHEWVWVIVGKQANDLKNHKIQQRVNQHELNRFWTRFI